MRALPAAALFLVLALSVACGGSAGGDEGSAPTRTSIAFTASCEPAKSAPAAARGQVETASGVRAYTVHLPADYNPLLQTPVVLILHGGGYADGAAFADVTGLARSAVAAGHIAVVMEGASNWNYAKSAAAPDDVDILASVIDAVSENYCIDDNLVFAGGYADGANMAQRLACEMPDRIAAIGVVAGEYIACQAAVPMVVVHGTADPIVPFEGGPAPGGLEHPPVRRWVSEWAATLGCDRLPAISRPSAVVELSTFPRCLAGDGEALLYAVMGAGHTWPGAPPLADASLDAAAAEFDATGAVVRFFQGRAGE